MKRNFFPKVISFDVLSCILQVNGSLTRQKKPNNGKLLKQSAKESKTFLNVQCPW